MSGVLEFCQWVWLVEPCLRSSRTGPARVGPPLPPANLGHKAHWFPDIAAWAGRCPLQYFMVVVDHRPDPGSPPVVVGRHVRRVCLFSVVGVSAQSRVRVRRPRRP